MELRSEYSAWQTMSALPRSSISFSDASCIQSQLSQSLEVLIAPSLPSAIDASGLNSKEAPESPQFADSSCKQFVASSHLTTLHLPSTTSEDIFHLHHHQCLGSGWNSPTLSANHLSHA
ncbi:hypothetical protein WMY93_032706 [Mugilogobius chulae]|uniref:Uncharacterized protein n=1 Tax=Mugilogobius chulae TaxID=88201 RepID=A0AAW0MMV2_9GOBI